MAGHVDGVIMYSLHGDDPLPGAAATAGHPGRRRWPAARRARASATSTTTTGAARAGDAATSSGSGGAGLATITGPHDMTAGDRSRSTGYREALRRPPAARPDELVATGSSPRRAASTRHARAARPRARPRRRVRGLGPDGAPARSQVAPGGRSASARRCRASSASTTRRSRSPRDRPSPASGSRSRSWVGSSSTVLLAGDRGADDVVRKVVLATELIVRRVEWRAADRRTIRRRIVDHVNAATSLSADIRRFEGTDPCERRSRSMRDRGVLDRGVRGRQHSADRLVERRRDGGCRSRRVAGASAQTRPQPARWHPRHATGAGPPEPAVHGLHGARSTPSSRTPIPGVTVDMSVVAPNDLATTTQTRLAANDVDVVDIFAFEHRRPAVHDGRHTAHLADARGRRQPAGPDRPAVRRQLRPGRDRRRGHLQRQGLRDQPRPRRLQRPVPQQGPVHREQRGGPHDLERAGGRMPDLHGSGRAVHHGRWPGRLADLRDRLRHPGQRVPGSAAATSQGLWEGTIKYNDEDEPRDVGAAAHPGAAR